MTYDTSAKIMVLVTHDTCGSRLNKAASAGKFDSVHWGSVLSALRGAGSMGAVLLALVAGVGAEPYQGRGAERPRPAAGRSCVR